MHAQLMEILRLVGGKLIGSQHHQSFGSYLGFGLCAYEQHIANFIHLEGLSLAAEQLKGI